MGASGSPWLFLPHTPGLLLINSLAPSAFMAGPGASPVCPCRYLLPGPKPGYKDSFSTKLLPVAGPFQGEGFMANGLGI